MDVSWKIIDKYFKDNPEFLVQHHLSSYNDFFKSGIVQILKEKNPIRIIKNPDPKTKDHNLKANLYIGGKEGNKIYYGKPIIYDDNRSHYMYPNEARLRNMTYGFSIHVEVDVQFLITHNNPEKAGTAEEYNVVETLITLPQKIYLGRFPIMIQSNLCILNNLPSQVRFNMGECKNEPGGYFIIDGKEKVIICQEKFADNMLYIKDNHSELYSTSAQIRSVSEDASKPIRTAAVRLVAPTTQLTNNQIVVNVPNVKKPVPLFILMRALGVISDKEIIETCLLDMEKNKNLIELFIPSIHDAGPIFTQETAIEYIKTFTKHKSIPSVLEILSNFFLPHIGEMNYKNKAYFVGYMVYKLLLVHVKAEKSTDRDSFNFKRVELSGKLIFDLFNEYYTIQQRNIWLSIDKEYTYHQGAYESPDTFPQLILNNYNQYFKEQTTANGFRKAFKGNWGAEAHTKKVGVVQDLNRLSFNSAISQLRKINLPLEESAKIVGPRLLHGSQWGLIDPVDTPDGGNIGTHKHLAITTNISDGFSSYPLIRFLREHGMRILEESTPKYIANVTKIIINGNWCGTTEEPVEMMKELKFRRRVAAIPLFTSISWNIEYNTIYIYTDAGRLLRPVFYVEQDGKDRIISYDKTDIKKRIENGEFTWADIVSGFTPKTNPDFSVHSKIIYGDLKKLYPDTKDIMEELENNKAIVEFIDTAEEETAYISIDHIDFNKTRFTNAEIHPSLILGVMGNQIIFPANNQLPRDLFSCGQSKQAVSLYHSNYQNRIDKMGVVLNYGQIPLVKSKYMKYINEEQHPYGVNVIVAIMTYTGYNVEDAIIFNQGAIDRGVFNTTYLNMYEAREDSSKVAGSMVDTRFVNIEESNVTNLKPGYDYSQLDDNGLIKEHTKMNDKMVVIGLALNDVDDPNKSMDSSITPKKGQLGYVDKAFMTEDEEGFRLAKVRIREERLPAIGDKFCSRCGQKGTCGIILPEDDMPFDANGNRPDIIINPHALPSRMTIGQLVESLMGKANLGFGAFGDCTAFENKGQKTEKYGKMLNQLGYHSSGNEILYNGMTGEQIDSEIFLGPTYYMRLKHMVKDKINYRAKGPRTALTRQTVGGRANDGGLRIGEMERDGIIANGMTHFLTESMLTRGDKYYLAVCNKSGTIAAYNKDRNIFLSPAVDGPLRYTKTLDGTLNIDNISKFGKSFSVLQIPFTLKLLMQELGTMNIQMRLITAENIDQLTSLSYSNNISKLMNNPKNTHGDDIKVSNLIRKIVFSSRNEVGDTVDRVEDNNNNNNNELSTSAPEGPSPDDITPALAEIPIVQPINSESQQITGEFLPTPEIPLPDETNDSSTAYSPTFIPSIYEEDQVYLIDDEVPGRIWTVSATDGDDIIIMTESIREGQEGMMIVSANDIKLVSSTQDQDTNQNSIAYVPSSPMGSYNNNSPIGEANISDDIVDRISDAVVGKLQINDNDDELAKKEIEEIVEVIDTPLLGEIQKDEEEEEEEQEKKSINI